MVPLIAVVFGLLPGITWLILYLREDTHREPTSLIVRTFLAGMISALVALVLQTGAQRLSANGLMAPLPLYAIPIGIIIFALIEEVCKFGAAYATVRNAPHFTQPIDAMIYVIIAALGFATVENIAIAYTTLLSTTPELQPVFQILALRFVGATLIHALGGALIGHAWGHALVRNGRSIGVVVGIALASALHAVFNLLILEYGTITNTLILIIGAGVLVLIDFHDIKQSDPLPQHAP